MTYQKKDHYHRKAKQEGFAARSAYKLQELQKKFNLIRRGNRVLDLGCAPGAWSQVVAPLVGREGSLVGIDFEPVEINLKEKNIRFERKDAFKLEASDLPEAPFHVILSDMAPRTSGVKVRDQALSVELAMRVLELCDKLLLPGGSMALKLFEGEDADQVKTAIKSRFKDLKIFRPQSTRQASFEVYLVGLGFKS
jgi:23S rRNA (uridine2552-2'-O)-methyltransferase